MGLLNRKDAKIYRGYFSEMCKLIGQSVGYQWVTEKSMTIHSEDNSKLSLPIRLDILFEDNPSVNTLDRLGWTNELGDSPIIAYLPYNTPNLTVNARITIETIDGVNKPRVFKITKIQSDLEFPDSYVCALVPVFNQYPQKNQYTLVNHEKINQDLSDRTSRNQPNSSYITDNESIDTTPKKYKEYEETYTFIDDRMSPYSG